MDSNVSHNDSCDQCDRVRLSVPWLNTWFDDRCFVPGAFSVCNRRAVPLPTRGFMALDLCDHRNDGALLQCLCLYSSVLRKSAFTERNRSNTVGTTFCCDTTPRFTVLLCPWGSWDHAIS